MASHLRIWITRIYVYVLRSKAFPNETYVGLTEDIDERIEEHNSGKSFHTKKYKPWVIQTKIWFDEKQKAIDFERYLKTGSGVAFKRKHL